jgi:hypothetical protein
LRAPKARQASIHPLAQVEQTFEKSLMKFVRGEKTMAPLLMHTREDKSLQVCAAESQQARPIGNIKNNFAINLTMIFIIGRWFFFNEFT